MNISTLFERQGHHCSTRMRHFIDKLHRAVLDVKWTEGSEATSTALLASTPGRREREVHNSHGSVRRGS